MHSNAKRRTPVAAPRVKGESGRQRRSFHELKAFGLWADRSGLKDPVRFTKELRTRMERGRDGG